MKGRSQTITTRRVAFVLGLVGVLVSSLIAIRVLATNEWDPTAFVAFGEDATQLTAYGEAALGREVITRPKAGHDGKFFFVQANDPLLLESEENIEIVDRPLYRAQRMLYPVLAGGIGLFSPDVMVWALIVVNVLASGLGTWAVAELALRMGGSAWWGLGFAVNPGLISELTIDGAGVVAAAAAFGAVLMIERKHPNIAIVLLAASALAREAMLVVAFGVAFWAWLQGDRRFAYRAAVIPTLAVGLWAIYIRLQVGVEAGISQLQGIGLPFAGFIASFQADAHETDVLARVGVLLLLGMYVRRTVIHRNLPLAWAFVGFAPLGILFTKEVWANSWDITRAVAPMITAFLLLVVLAARQYRETVAADRITG